MSGAAGARARRRGWRRYGPSLVLALGAVGVWEVAVRGLRVPDYLLPAPSAVAADFAGDRRLLLDNSLVTLRELVLGFALAVAAGLALAVVLHLSGTLRRALYPILIGSQTVPVVVLAPVPVILLGYLMLQATPNLDTPRIFAAIVILTLLSLALFLSVSLLERLLVPWARVGPARELQEAQGP